MAVPDSPQATSIAGNLGRELNLARARRHLTQAELGKRIGLSGARIGELERGDGATAPLAVWVRVGEAIDRPLAVTFSADTEADETPHPRMIAAQELVLGLAREHGRLADIEGRNRPTTLSSSTDVVVQDDVARALILIEIRESFEGSGVAFVDQGLGSEEPDPVDRPMLAHRNAPAYRVARCCLLMDTTVNRRLIVRQSEILARYPGSSLGWVRCLADGEPAPTEPGLAWFDPRTRRIRAFRRRGI